jgi:hypothetical protein
MFLSIGERVFLVEYVFQEGSRCTDFIPPEFNLWGAAQSAVCVVMAHARFGLKTATTAYIRSISQADLQKVLQIKLNGSRPV